jgi:hypothetical protein
LHLVAPEDLEEFLSGREPSAVLTGVEEEDEELPLIQWAERHGYRKGRPAQKAVSCGLPPKGSWVSKGDASTERCGRRMEHCHNRIRRLPQMDYALQQIEYAFQQSDYAHGQSDEEFQQLNLYILTGWRENCNSWILPFDDRIGHSSKWIRHATAGIKYSNS